MTSFGKAEIALELFSFMLKTLLQTLGQETLGRLRGPGCWVNVQRTVYFHLQVGCGISNVNMIRDALFTQTKHVQFVVFERADQVDLWRWPSKALQPFVNSFRFWARWETRDSCLKSQLSTEDRQLRYWACLLVPSLSVSTELLDMLNLLDLVSAGFFCLTCSLQRVIENFVLK